MKTSTPIAVLLALGSLGSCAPTPATTSSVSVSASSASASAHIDPSSWLCNRDTPCNGWSGLAESRAGDGLLQKRNFLDWVTDIIGNITKR